MKHEIEIPDLPEDLEAVAYRKPKAGEYYLTPDWITVEALHDYKLAHLIVRRKQVVEMPYKIRIQNLPEGWEPVEILIDPDQYNKYVGDDGCLYWDAKIRMKKKQPRRIVFEETCKEDRKAFLHAGKYWKIVEDGK